MIIYGARKLIYSLTLLMGVFLSTFLLFHAVPSDPARTVLGANASEAEVTALRHELGLDRPLISQLASFALRVVHLDLGSSFVDGRRVAPEVGRRLRLSLVLVGFSLAIALIYVIATAAIEVLLQNRIGELLDFLCVSTPSLFSGVVLSLLAVRFYPFSYFSGHLNSPEYFLALLPPAIALALYPMAVLSRILRSELRAAANAPFVVAARAAGHPEHWILFRYMARSAVLPVLSALSSLLPMLFTGAYVVEVIFSLPAAGTLLAKSLLQRDWPMIEGLVLLNGCLVLGIRFAVELAFPLVDPRVNNHGD